MKELILGFPQQLIDALSIASKVQPPQNSDVKIENILICGLGGSGIGGTIIQNYLSDRSPYPIQVHKDYGVPVYVNAHTLVICCSYSGNTEETLDAYNAALSRNAQLFIVASGGQLIEYAQRDGNPFIKIPDGNPPRSCLGYSLVQLFRIIELYGIIGDSYQKEIKDAAQLLIKSKDQIQSDSRNLANNLDNKLPVLYSDNQMEGVTIRWRQQLNENGKILCWHQIIPEMNHNELEGWSKKELDKYVIVLRHSYEHNRSSLRSTLVEDIIGKYTSGITYVQAKGNTKLEQIIYLIHYGDWLSISVSEINNSDASEVKVIDYLKSKLENN